MSAARWSADSGRAPVGRYGNADRHLRENDAIIDLGGGEICDLDTATPERLMHAAAKLRARRVLPVDIDPFVAKPEAAPQHDVSSLNARRVDFHYEADAQQARSARAMAEIQKALAEEEAQTQKAKADVHSQFKQRAGSLGRLLMR
jgi:hypothetical protein